MIASTTDPPTATPFFMHGVAPGELAEAEYERLRRCAQTTTGHVPLDRRIHRIWCRMEGRDVTFEVGATAPDGTTSVVAILDLGRHLNYAIFTTGDDDVPALEIGKHVYSVTEFA
jgi:hypothetical protein